MLSSYSFLSLQDGSNVFHLCAAGGNIAIAQFLAPMMENHLFDVDEDGYTALHWATQVGQLSMVEYLVKSCGFDLKAKNKVGLLQMFPCYLVCFLPLLFATSPGLLFLHGHGINEGCDTYLIVL